MKFNQLLLFLFFIAIFSHAFGAVCDNFVRIYAQSVSGATLPDQARIWDRNGYTIKTVQQTADTNFSCIKDWGEEIKIPVFAGEGLKYRGSGDDALIIDYTKTDGKVVRKITASDDRFNGVRLALLDLNISPDSSDPASFPEDGFIVFQATYNACEKNELFLSACACTSDCTPSGARECVDKQASPNTFRVCSNFDNDPCFEWGAPQACAATTPSCDANGNCVGKCKNECVAGKKECVNAVDKPNLFRECGNFDDDSCFEWNTAQECPKEKQSCDINGNCTSSCENDCAKSGAKACTNVVAVPNTFKTCGNFDNDLCLEWGNVETCTTQKAYCDKNGNCNCLDDCPKKGVRECFTDSIPNEYRECGNFDNDSCLEWTPKYYCYFATPICDANKGSCERECTDECKKNNSIECADSKKFPNIFQECGNFDKDSCLELGEIQACPVETPACDANNGCVKVDCENDCSEEGAKECVDKKKVPNTLRECGQFDADVCLDWEKEEKCPENAQACTGDGSCVSLCFDECPEAGKKECLGTAITPYIFKECGNFDKDPCMEWSKPKNCPAETPVCDETNNCVAKIETRELEPAISEFFSGLLKPLIEFFKSIGKIFGKH